MFGNTNKGSPGADRLPPAPARQPDAASLVLPSGMFYSMSGSRFSGTSSSCSGFCTRYLNSLKAEA